MTVVVTDIPFDLQKKRISLTELLSSYVSFVQDQQNCTTVAKDVKHDDGKRYSLDDIRKLYHV